ncbi:uncharacterized protein BDZ99DRAFT_459351 [Mytilinidion resinicola]|uniref:Uncharacterized protein n=1 Tax=Mytilinidion resinicola TaxID=574789 RepID=A0A6A6Z4B8_9PEZI|nr:uncharacterized protein BDZ99DRAFT_459351 [Mytilinidion resinicola]KAF2815503.1 hypothetical protein BDZ99DRAFT_459351 [Mytilinidion resinicola]
MTSAEDLLSSQPCRFLSLPREIRDEVYSWLVPQPPDHHRRIWLHLPPSQDDEPHSPEPTESNMMEALTLETNEKVSSAIIDVDVDQNPKYITRYAESDIGSDWTYESSLYASSVSESDLHEPSSDHDESGSDESGSDNENLDAEFKLPKRHTEASDGPIVTETCILDILLINRQIHHEFMESFSRKANIWLYVRMENTAEDPCTFTFDPKFWKLPYLRSVRRLFIIAEWHSRLGRNMWGYVYGPDDHPSFDIHYPEDRNRVQPLPQKVPSRPQPPNYVFPYTVNNLEADVYPEQPGPVYRSVQIEDLPRPVTAHYTDRRNIGREPHPTQPRCDMDALNAFCKDAASAYEELGDVVDSFLERTKNVTGLDITLKTNCYEYDGWNFHDGAHEDTIIRFRPAHPGVKYIAKTIVQDDVVVRRREETFIEGAGWQYYLGGSLLGQKSRIEEQKWDFKEEGPYVMKREGPDSEWTDWEID